MKNPFEIQGPPLPTKHRDLSWEEAALRPREMVEGFTESIGRGTMVSIIPVLAVICFAILAVQLFRLQLVEGSNYRVLAEGNRLRERLVLAPRGFIKDRYGSILTQNTVSFTLVAVPLDLPKEGLDQEIESLAAAFGLSAEEIKNVIAKVDRRSFEQVIIAEDITREQSILFETRESEFVGFQIQRTPIREYPNANIFSHVIGYTGRVNDEEFKSLRAEGYANQDFIGKIGIEKQYEQYLRGVNGHEQIEVDATGRVVKLLGSVDPEPGNIVELAIDKELQEKIYTELSAKGAKGAVVAMNPKTGEVLALVSLPGFDNNLFSHGITNAEYQTLLQDKDLPLFNRAISGTYPPGSTVKPMVAAAALQEGIVTDKTVIVDRGVLVIPNQFDPRINYNFYGWQRSGLGPMTARSAIAKSSDIYFYTVAGGHPSSPIKGMGAEKLAEYYRSFGLGKITGLDLGGEKPGIVADPEWKANYFKDNSILSKWYLGNTYHIGIGQGDMLTTPLQVTLWTSAIANNGKGMKPYLLKRVVTQDGDALFEPKQEVIVSPPISEENIRVAQEGMRQTILDGSGVQLLSLPITSAGKTGTSQFDGADPSRTHAWFTVYAPYENPEIALTVLVEAGGEGHAAAVPVAKEALQWWAEHRYNK
jgi:penicillin-binding protein 2